MEEDNLVALQIFMWHFSHTEGETMEKVKWCLWENMTIDNEGQHYWWSRGGQLNGIEEMIYG